MAAISDYFTDLNYFLVDLLDIVNLHTLCGFRWSYIEFIYLMLNLRYLSYYNWGVSLKIVFFRKTTPPPSLLNHYTLFQNWRGSSRHTASVGCMGQNFFNILSAKETRIHHFPNPKFCFYAMYSVGFLIEGTHHALAAIGVGVLCFESLSERLRQLGAKTIKLTLSVRLVLIPRESKHDFLLKIE